MKVISIIDNFKLIRDSRDFIVINQERDYEAHAHFKSEQGARDCIRFIRKGLLPKSKYMQTACKRLMNLDDYEKLIERKKEKYVNVNRGIKR